MQLLNSRRRESMGEQRTTATIPLTENNSAVFVALLVEAMLSTVTIVKRAGFWNL